MHIFQTCTFCFVQNTCTFWGGARHIHCHCTPCRLDTLHLCAVWGNDISACNNRTWSVCKYFSPFREPSCTCSCSSWLWYLFSDVSFCLFWYFEFSVFFVFYILCFFWCFVFYVFLCFFLLLFLSTDLTFLHVSQLMVNLGTESPYELGFFGDLYRQVGRMLQNIS